MELSKMETVEREEWRQKKRRKRKRKKKKKRRRPMETNPESEINSVVICQRPYVWLNSLEPHWLTSPFVLE
jgi:hypothetical protein